VSGLPDTWTQFPFRIAIEKIVGGGTPSKANPNFFSGDIPFMTVKDLSRRFPEDTIDHITREAVHSSSTAIIQKDTLIVATRMSLGKIVRPKFDTAINQDLKAITLREGFDKTYIEFLWRHFASHIQSLGTGTTVKGIRLDDIYNLLIPVAPPAEQKRIAAKLEVVLERLEACRTRLGRVPDLLKRFRQSVLASATSGQLTEDWRKKPIIDSWTKKGLKELGELGRGKSKHRPRNDPRLYGGSYPFVQTGDVANSKGLIKSHSQTYSDFGLAQSKLWPAGTVCITIAANIADTAILTYPACFPDSVVGFVANPSKCRPEFIKWTVDVIKDELESFAPATAQKNINLAVLNELEISCPPVLEQEEIVRRVKTLFAFADRIESSLMTVRAQVERLTPATLAKAFRGELVPQDPKDTPASVLLEAARKPATSPSFKLEIIGGPSSGKSSFITSLVTKQLPSLTSSNMKTRFDSDVQEKPYLANLLKLRTRASAEQLFQDAQLSLVDFYKQLSWEMDQGMIVDSETELEAQPNET
jgi:type I restriction enzyme S subunit